MIRKYNNFKEDKLLESINESYLYFTNNFRDILKKMKKNKISSDILDAERTDVKPDMTFIDLSSKEGHISFSQIKKGISIIKKWADAEGYSEDDVKHIYRDIDNGYFNLSSSWSFKDALLSKSRNDVKIGKLINSMFPSKYTPQEVEEFVSRFKRYTSGENDNKFKIVEGDEILAPYLYSNYADDSGTLGNSCMRSRSSQSFFDIYTKNKDVCRLLVLSDVDDLVVGRVLIWKFSSISSDELKEAEYFMDRIYTIDDSIMNDFKDYATTNGWIRRTNTGYSDTQTLTYNDKIYYDVDMEVKLESYSDIEKFPYMDTFKRLNIETGILYNDDKMISSCYKLEDTGGGYESTDRVWSEYHDEYIDEAEAVYSEPLNSHIYSEGARIVHYGALRRRGWYPEDYDDIFYDEYREEYIHEQDSSYCEYEESSYYENDSVNCITEFNGVDDYNYEGFSDKSTNIIESKYMQCYSYLYDNDFEDYYFNKDILGSADTGFSRNYYFKKFEVKLIKTTLGNYTQVDCDILGIKNISEFDKQGKPNRFSSDEFAYNSSIDVSKLMTACKEKMNYYKSILDGNQVRLNFEDEDSFRKKSEELYKYFSERYDELENI
jgi:hypothetical protein